MAIAILAQSVVNLSPANTVYTISSFAVPAGTNTLLVLPTQRGPSSSTPVAAISSITHNGVALTAGFNNYAANAFDIDSYIGYLRSPNVGTFDIVINCANTTGGAAWILALSGVVAAGNPVGATNAQRNSSSGSTSVGLGFTPTAGSLLLAAIASGNNPGTITGFTGTGFTETITGRYSPNGDMPYTAWYLPNATATAVTVSATFDTASVNNGGLLAEIRGEATGTDVAGTAAATLDVTGSIATDTIGVSKAEIADASFRQRAAWTEVLSLQADTAGVARRIISAGIAGSPTLTVDQLAPNKNYSWRYRLADGTVQVDSGSNTQSLSPQHLALVHNGASGQELYLNGAPVGTVIEGGGLSGTAVVQGGETIGAHSAGSPAPYSGLVGRYLLYESAMTEEQVRLLALSETDPDALWGIGVEDDARVSNQSVVACPLHAALDGQPSMTLSPSILDPSGGARSISAVTQPANGSLAISGLDLIYTPTRGWQGSDSASYTATDGTTSSTGRLTFQQTRPALKCANDTVTVASGGVATFDPRANDVGAGPLRVTSVSTPATGTASILADGRVQYTNTSGTTDSFSCTIDDDYSRQTATVSVTITAGSFLTANPVSVSTTKDTFVDADVVAAASVSSDLSPAVVKSGSVTAPSLGTAALQASGLIRYTPPTGNDGFSTEFDFTLKPSAKALPESTNTVTVNVQAESSSGLPRLQPNVPVSRWHCVGFSQTGAKSNDVASFAAAVALGNLVAGDVIVLGDGVWGGSPVTCGKSGAASADGSNHIMVRARNHGKASINHQLEITGAYWWFTGIKFPWNAGSASADIGNGGKADTGFTGEAQSVHCYNAGLWITNSRFTGYAFIRIYPDNKIKNLRFCYNTVNSTIPGVIAHDTGIFILCHETTQTDRAPIDTEIAWNKVTMPTKASNNDRSRPIIQIQPSHAKSNDMANFCTQSFRFHHNHCVGAWAEAFYCKRNITIEYNYIEWSNNSTARHMVTFRHGILSNSGKYDIGGIIRGNRFHRTAERLAILISGTGISVTSNVHEGGGYGEVWVCSGNGLGNFDFPGGVPRDGADYAQVVDNVGFNTVIVGGEPGASNVGAETAGGRNGWPDHVRIFRGDRGWDPAITRPSDGGEQAPAPTITGGFGTGNAAKVTTITEAALLNAVPPVGCDPPIP